MTDETSTPTQEPEATTAPETTEEATTGEQEGQQPEKLGQTVKIEDIGPCKKHIRVEIERTGIQELLNDKFAELMQKTVIPGFRKGKAPRKVVERQFGKDVVQEVKGQVLMASLEQLAEDHDIAPLATPDLDPTKIDIPEEGPMIYEFDVEVRPDFELPDYRGLKIKRVIRKFTDEEVAAQERRILARYGQLVPKEGPAELEDYLVVDMTTRVGGQVIGTAKEVTLQVVPRLAFKDGVAERFGEEMVGVKAGESREVEILMSGAVAMRQLAGQTVRATLTVKDVKKMRLPDLTEEFLSELGVTSAEQLHERVLALLERQHEYQQRQSARKQVLGYIEASATWDLPQDLLQRHARSAMNRRIMEMREAGISDAEIQAQQRLLQQDVLHTTAASLKEHFVFQKIAEVEKIDVDEDDLQAEIEQLAEQHNESPRRIRAQLEKNDELQVLAVTLIERKVLDLILDSAVYEDEEYKGEGEKSVGVAEQQAVEGELQDPTAPPPKPETEEGSTESQPS